MRPLSDKVVDHLRHICDIPDLQGTKYSLIEEIGRGGMGAVYAVEDTELGRRVALKVLHTDSDEPVKEPRVLAQLEHPGIVPIYDAGVLADGRRFYVMQLVEGTRLDECGQTSASLPGRLRIFEKICEAVAFSHSEGVVHRDLKPENIMIGAFGEVLIMDWGLAKIMGDPAAERHGTVVGTAAYMAPEQARGETDRIDERSDVYSLGAILEFLAGPSPPRRLKAVCRKARAPDPAARYQGAAELARDVASFLDGLPLIAYREGPLERISRWASRHRTACILVVAYLVMRVLFILFFRR